MNPTRAQILKALEEMSELYPHWRFGQTVANISDWAVEPTDPRFPGVWDVEDEAFLAALQQHIRHRKQQLAKADAPSP